MAPATTHIEYQQLEETVKMKIILFTIILLGVSCTGKSQIVGYESFLNEFKNVEIPIRIDRGTYKGMFFFNEGYKEVPVWMVEKFICVSGLKCEIDPNRSRYDFGISYKLKELDVTLVHKQNYEGDNIYNFDLSESILTIYNKKGEILSQKAIGKDNDAWISNIFIDQDMIKVLQAKLLEFNKDRMNCEKEVIEYQISREGVIKKLSHDLVRDCFVVWDNHIKDFRINE
jgi:hypothetical protein